MGGWCLFSSDTDYLHSGEGQSGSTIIIRWQGREKKEVVQGQG